MQMYMCVIYMLYVYVCICIHHSNMYTNAALTYVQHIYTNIVHIYVYVCYVWVFIHVYVWHVCGMFVVYDNLNPYALPWVVNLWLNLHVPYNAHRSTEWHWTRIWASSEWQQGLETVTVGANKNQGSCLYHN